MKNFFARLLAAILCVAAFPVVTSAQVAIDPGARGLAIQAKAAVRTMPQLLVAACNAPARVKAKADYVSACDGHDEVLLTNIINSCPDLVQTERSKVAVIGGKNCYLVLSEGKFELATTWTIPPGSVVGIDGVGVPSWRPIDTVNSNYEGGTLLYSKAPNGVALSFPQYTGTRTDSGATNTIPASGITLRNFQIVVFNPATTQSGYALDLSGMTTGIVGNVNVFADLSVNAEPRINGGVNLGAGARSDRKTITGMHVFFFRQVGFLIGTTHLDASQLVGGYITGGTSPSVYQITAAQNVRLFNLHAFSAATGIKITNAEPINIDSVMFESITTPMTLTSATAYGVRVNNVYLNADVPWTGDIVNRVQVGWLGGTAVFNNGAVITRIRNGGTVTIPAGQTSITIPHQLIATPLSYRASVLGGGNITTTTTADATNLTVTIPAAQGTATTINWSATATINEAASAATVGRLPANDNEHEVRAA